MAEEADQTRWLLSSMMGIHLEEMQRFYRDRFFGSLMVPFPTLLGFRMPKGVLLKRWYVGGCWCIIEHDTRKANIVGAPDLSCGGADASNTANIILTRCDDLRFRIPKMKLILVLCTYPFKSGFVYKYVLSEPPRLVSVCSRTC
jgi:hypothetical protein